MSSPTSLWSLTLLSFIFFSSVADEEKEEGGKEVGEKEREGEKRRAWDGDGGVNVLVEGKGLNGLTGTTKMTITVRRYRGDIRGGFLCRGGKKPEILVNLAYVSELGWRERANFST